MHMSPEPKYAAARPHEWEAAMTSDIARRMKLFTQAARSIGQSPSIGTTAAALVQVVWQIVVAIKHRRELARLTDCNDRMLADIGLRRSDLHAARSVPLWQDPDIGRSIEGPVVE
jgi:uncharacterized protein YjiS (DUF1127 family)